MGRSWCVVLVLAGCASGGAPVEPADGDPGDDGCTPQTYFADTDQDGHGDAAAAMVACVQPPNTVTISDDCDDADPARFPGQAEVCDGADNDCDGATVEQCPAGCSVQKRPPPDDAKVYLFCLNAAAWVNARTTCNTAGFKIVQIDDAAENAYVRSTANSLLGTGDIHIGASDITAENMWIWDGGDQFWQGGSGGTPVGGRFENWESGEPNDDGTEDCAEMRGNGQWNDGSCGDGQRFACRK